MIKSKKVYYRNPGRQIIFPFTFRASYECKQPLFYCKLHSLQIQKNIIDCYDRTANNYAAKFINELENKHLDKILLQSFAEENIASGKLIDLGCGPGQTTKYLFDCGLSDLMGIDISPKMIEVAKIINPGLHFEIADILNLHYPDRFFGSAIAFYSLVHFDYDQIKIAFNEIKRVLKNGGQFLFSFHIGDNTIHLDNFLEEEVNIDFYFFEVSKIISLLHKSGFTMIDVIERHPYENVEHASKRAYILVQKQQS